MSAFTNKMESLFPVEREYARCVTALNRTGILTLLLKSESIGVIGTDGKEYPIPTREQVVELFIVKHQTFITINPNSLYALV